MPLVNESSNFIYLNFFEGNFTKKVSEDYKQTTDEKIVKRENKNGAIVYELHYDTLKDVVLVEIREVNHDEWGAQWEFVFLDENKYLVLRLSKTSRIANQFLKKLENLVLVEPFTIHSFYFPEESKSGINIYQNGVKIENVYTKDNPGNCPPPVQVVVNNETTWDWSDQLDYWSKVVNSLRPHMLGINNDISKVISDQADKEVKPNIEEAKDKMPKDDVDELRF